MTLILKLTPIYRHVDDESADDESADDEDDAVEDLQAGHSSAVAMAHYARLQGRSKFLDDRFFLNYVNCSKRYHQLLQLCPPPRYSQELSRQEKNFLSNASLVMGSSVQQHPLSPLEAGIQPVELMASQAREHLLKDIKDIVTATVKSMLPSPGTTQDQAVIGSANAEERPSE